MSQEKFENEVPSEMSVATTNNQLVSVDLDQLDDQIKSMMEHTGKIMEMGQQKRAVMICKVCGKEGGMSNLKVHIEANHITGVTHTCDICKKTSRSRHALYMHKREHHS